MIRPSLAVLGAAAATGALADDLTDSQRLLCAAGEITVCFELEECLPVLADDVGVPRFVVVDLEKKELATTKASKLNRRTAFSTMIREGGRIYLQGVERGRAFSLVINEDTGKLTVAVSRDGLSVTVFGACTDADL